MKSKSSVNDILYCSALTATLVRVSKYAVMAHVRYAAYLWGGSIRSALRLLFVLQRKRICSVWWPLLSADGRRKFLLEVQSLIPQREGNTPCCPLERESHLSNSLDYYGLANSGMHSCQSHHSFLLRNLPWSSVTAGAHQRLCPPTSKSWLHTSSADSFGFLTLNPVLSSFYLLALLQHTIFPEEAYIVFFIPLVYVSSPVDADRRIIAVAIYQVLKTIFCHHVVANTMS